jgi:hypothetical protein
MLAPWCCFHDEGRKLTAGGHLLTLLKIPCYMSIKILSMAGLTRFLVSCNWGRAGLDGHTFDTLEK